MKINKILLFLLISSTYGFAQYSQEPLKYRLDALEPYIDSQTMDIHFNKHHVGYINNLNKAVKGTRFEKMTMDELLANVTDLNSTIRNNAGGHYNHQLFWSILTPNLNTKPSKSLQKAIVKSFVSMDNFKVELAKEGATRFGSGWVWLLVNSNNELEISSTPNQDNPLMDDVDKQGIPILGIDVWEHAYYLKYQNKRSDYLSAIWNVINWGQVSENYQNALKSNKTLKN